MSYTKMMKSPDEDVQTIEQDNKKYSFNPKAGTLTAPAPIKPTMEQELNRQNPVKAKTIMPKTSEVEVGSVRG